MGLFVWMDFSVIFISWEFVKVDDDVWKEVRWVVDFEYMFFVMGKIEECFGLDCFVKNFLKLSFVKR